MSQCDEDRSVYNGHFELEVLIDRPVEEVWPQFIDIPSWVTSHDIETVYGTPGTVGSITRVSFKKAKEQGFPLAHHHYCKLIKVVPERQWILKTYPERSGLDEYGHQPRRHGEESQQSEENSGKPLIHYRKAGRSQLALTRMPL